MSMLNNEDYKKRFVFSYTEPSYDYDTLNQPELTRTIELEFEESVQYGDVVEQFLFFLSGCWGYSITLEDCIVRKHANAGEDSNNPLHSFPEVLKGKDSLPPLFNRRNSDSLIE